MKNLLNRLRATLKFIWYLKKVIVNYAYDLRRFIHYSSIFRKKDDLKLLVTHIMMHVHSIERALSLRNPRLGFGKDRIFNLIELLHNYVQQGYDTDHYVFIMGVSVLDSYSNFHEERNYKLDIPLKSILSLKGFLVGQTERRGGIKEITKDMYLENSKLDFPAFSRNRVSIRDFSEEKVNPELIKEAIKIAQKSPSVCNRQSVRAYIVNDETMLMNTQKILTGTRGFDHLIKQVIILTSDLSSFINIGERNQCYIDGGIFLMSLLYGLQSLGLGACTLNWSVEKNKDKALRNICKIDNAENIIALIAVGHLVDKFLVPVSSRLDMEDIVKIR